MFLIVHRGEHKLSELTEGSLGTFSLSNQCIKLMSCPAAVIWNKAGQANAFPIWASRFGYCKTQPHYHHRQLKGNSRLRTRTTQPQREPLIFSILFRTEQTVYKFISFKASLLQSSKQSFCNKSTVFKSAFQNVFVGIQLSAMSKVRYAQ